MGAPYVSIVTRARPAVRCGGCDRLVPLATTTTAEGVRLCQSCALLYACAVETERDTPARLLAR